MSVKEIIKSKILDKIECNKIIHVTDSYILLRIHSKPQYFETTAQLLLVLYIKQLNQSFEPMILQLLEMVKGDFNKNDI